MLLDFHLGKLEIATDSIQGYRQEEFTHLAVAAAIASGRADCGMGIAAAAQALDLDFVPLFDERYDLAIPLAYANDELLSPLFDLMNTDCLREAVAAQPGYDVSDMGKIQFEGEKITLPASPKCYDFGEGLVILNSAFLFAD